MASLELATNQNHTYIIGSVIFTPVSASASVTCGECFDPGACNFVPNATLPNNSLCIYASDLYPSGLYDCDGNCYADLDEDGICNALEIPGCQDPLACNYNPEATDPAEPLNPCIYLSGDNDDCDGITFNVDMACAPSDFDNVFVSGPWCGWCANDAFNTMTDFDGDGVYSVTIPDLFGEVEYKYAINGFAGQENLVNDMVNGSECAPITDFAGYANRTILANNGVVVYDYYGTCDGECNDAIPDPPSVVTFQVDMAGYQGSFNMVNLNGSFNGWCGSCTPMTDEDGDGVFSCDVGLNDGAIEYKFTVDGWTDQEMFSVGTPCTVTLNGFTNRTFDVSGNETLPVVCWNSCNACRVVGCTDFDACNYDASAILDNGLCDYSCLGCTDPSACNFNLAVTVDDGTCQYLDIVGVCGGSCQTDLNNNGICDDAEATIYVELDTSFFGANTPSPGDNFDVNGLLEGYNSFIVYAEFSDETDVLSAIFSDTAALPQSVSMGIDAPCGCFNPLDNDFVLNATNTSFVWDFFPMNEYDTFWTIGMLSGDATFDGIPGTIPSKVGDTNGNEAGSNICNSQLTNGTIFITGSEGYWPSNAVAGEDLKVEIARVTTCGSFSISGGIQSFLSGSLNNVSQTYFDVTVIPGCTD